MVVVAGAVMLLWPAIINGQPFFYADTPNYVRAPDAAVVWAFGPRFATPWTDSDVIEAFSWRFAKSSSTAKPQLDKPLPSDSGVATERRGHHSNSLRNGLIVAGRSAYYGALLYIGELAGGFWLSVFSQALIVAYVTFILALRCYGLSFRVFLITIVALAAVSTAPFFVSFLMPDIFAGVAILIVAILISFWENLKHFERIIMALTLTFALITHLTHLMVCIAMLGIYVVAKLSRGFSYKLFRSGAVVTIAACIAIAILGDLCFDFVVHKVVGFSPVRPPFVMARLIEIGPGYQYLKANCGNAAFTVCRFLKQMPRPADSFLWNQDAAVGVFTPADPETKRALGDEQYAFAIRVLMFDPIGVSVGLLRSGLRQMGTFGLEEFHYCDQCFIALRDNLPAEYSEKMQNTIALRYSWPWQVFTIIDYIFVILSLIVLAVAAVIHFNREVGRYFVIQLEACRLLPVWFFAAVALGIASNALICGAFSAVHDRYQARVIWLVPLAAIMLLVRCMRFGHEPPSREQTQVSS